MAGKRTIKRRGREKHGWNTNTAPITLRRR